MDMIVYFSILIFKLDRNNFLAVNKFRAGWEAVVVVVEEVVGEVHDDGDDDVYGKSTDDDVLLHLK